jgi:hypothetical protein
MSCAVTDCEKTIKENNKRKKGDLFDITRITVLQRFVFYFIGIKLASFIIFGGKTPD